MKPAAVTNWLKGRFSSQRIEAACREYAEKLLAEEKAAA